MITPAPPRAMTLPNSSRTSAVPYRSTFRIVAGDACVGETPAAWIRPVTSPRPVAVLTSASTAAREDASTVATLTSYPASPRTSAAALAFPTACRPTQHAYRRLRGARSLGRSDQLLRPQLHLS